MTVSLAIRVLKLVVIISFAVIVTGCATQTRLTIYSQPEGAYLTERGTGKAFGLAPVTVVYDPLVLAKHRQSDGCYLVKGFEARWVSGASAYLDNMKICGSPYGAYQITYSRNPNDPGFDKDLQFSIQVQSVRAQQQQAQAANDASSIALYNAIMSNQKQSLNCSSYQVGDTIQTRCR